MSNQTFTQYETGLTRLLAQLGNQHPKYADALVFQHRLLENIRQTTTYGDTETHRADRAQIVDGLNRLTMNALGISFNELCREVADAGRDVQRPPQQLPDPEIAPEPEQEPTAEIRQHESPVLPEQHNLKQRLLASLRDPVWQAVAAIVAIFTLIVTVWAIQQPANISATTEPTENAIQNNGVTSDRSLGETMPASSLFPTPEPFSIQYIAFDPPSPSSADSVRVFACTSGYSGVGITLKIHVNSAPDGSASGTWQLLKELGVPCFSQVDAPVWHTREWTPGTYLVKAEAKGPDDLYWTYPVILTTTYTLEPKNE